jgi:Fe-S cluster assembly iron-binding protein IscA
MGINTRCSWPPNGCPTTSKFYYIFFNSIVHHFSSQFTHPSIKPSNILVDAVSFALVNGSTIDFAVELIGSTFRVAHNPQAKGSGCGCGVSWELKD